MDMNLSKLQKIVKDREPGMLQSIGSQRVRHSLVAGQHSNNNNNTCGYVCSCFCFSLTVPFLSQNLSSNCLVLEKSLYIFGHYVSLTN